MFIDIHAHTRTIPGPPMYGKPSFSTPGQLLERYAAIQVEAAVLLPGVNPECASAPQSNEEVLAVAETCPGRFIPFCNVDPRSMYNRADAPLGDMLRFLNAFQDRLFFGTDICAPDTPTPLVEFLRDLRQRGRISETVFQEVARKNAIRLLKLAIA